MYKNENLARLKKELDDLAPDVREAFRAFNSTVIADGAIPAKYKELIAVAVALTTQCPHCIDFHSSNAREAGVTDAEMFEAAVIAASLQVGVADTHAAHAVPIKLTILTNSARAK